MEKLLAFLVELGINQDLLDCYIKDPARAYQAAGLSGKEIELLKAGDSKELYNQLFSDLGIRDKVDEFCCIQTHCSKFSD